MSSLKNDRSLFSRLYIATCEHQSGDPTTLFAHENQQSPPSLSILGGLRSCTKSDLVKCILNASPECPVMNAPPVHAKILDWPAIVHMLSPGQSITFQDYVDSIFLPFLTNELASVLRLDLVWDRYDPASLKNMTRDKRGQGVRTRVTPSTKISKGWANFLRDSGNKEELFKLLASSISSLKIEGKEVKSTLGTDVITTSVRDQTGKLAPCNHEEADTLMMVHTADAVAQRVYCCALWIPMCWPSQLAVFPRFLE